MTRSPLDKERVARVLGKAPRIIKIESAADKSIDRLVYELSRKEMIYGIDPTGDEIESQLRKNAAPTLRS